MHTPFEKFELPVLAFLGSRICFGLSMQMVAVALGWHIYEITSDAFKLALVGLVFVLPIFVFFFLTGFVIDRVRRKDILIGATSIDAIAFVGMAVALTSDVVSLDWVYLFISIHGIAHAFFTPAQAAFLANLVSPTILPKAIALNSTMGHLATTVGPFAAGRFCGSHRSRSARYVAFGGRTHCGSEFSIRCYYRCSRSGRQSHYRARNDCHREW